MSKACNGNQPHFSMSAQNISQSMADTLAQMLSGMCKRHGSGTGKKPGQGMSMAEGQGMAGSGDSGTAMEGDPIMQSPVYGPGRMSFGNESQLTGEARGNGKGRNAVTSVKKDAQAKIESKATRTETRRQISLRDVPERYRDAVRRFYGEESVKETTTQQPPPQQP
jgi:hypothetical protein